MCTILKIVGTFSPERVGDKSVHQCMKDYARRHAQAVPGAHEKAGPRRRFVLLSAKEKTERITDERLNRVQVCFGVKKPPDRKDECRQGWQGLVAWQWIEEADGSEHGLVTLDMERARFIDADSWLEGFILSVLDECNWQVVDRMVNQQASC